MVSFFFNLNPQGQYYLSTREKQKKILITCTCLFSRGKLKIILKDVAKKSASTRKKSGKKQTQAGSKKQGTKKPVMKSKMKAVIPKMHQEKTLPKDQKGKGKNG